MPYRVFDVSSWELAGHETVGRTEHPWLRDASTQQLYLWKPVTAKRLERREHLAEKLAAELARAVGVPCATAELAVRAGVPGCLSRNVQPSGWERRFGADLLLDLDPSFRATVKRHATYTVTNVFTVLSDVGPPKEPPLADPALQDAFDVFAGYLVFDALVLNRDRHAKNWAVLRPRDGGAERLCALYDNASSLGLALSDGRASRIAAGKGADSYVRKEAWARAFAQRAGCDSTLFEIAADALQLCSAPAKQHWLERVSALSDSVVVKLVAAVPGLPAPLRTLVPMLVASARRRILDAR